MSFIKKAALCASLFLATATSVFGQNSPNQNSTHPPKTPDDLLHNTELMVLLHSRHSDRLTPYNENNFGVFLNHKTGGSGNYRSSIMEGAYYNSNYTVSPTIGMLNEIQVGKCRFGLLAGIAIYPRVEKDVVTYNTVYSVDMPHNEHHRGASKIFIPTGKPYEYTEVDKTYKARGIKNKFRIIPALLATFSYNAYHGLGPFATATYVPWKSGEHDHLFIGAIGARYAPEVH